MVSDPLTLAPTWVDVSAYVRQIPGVSIRRGRQRELDNFDAGSCHITLSNRDRRFDPSYAAGPYFGNLLPRKQIRVTATWAAVDYVMFQGWVTGWPQSLASPGIKDATVTIEAVDALAWLSTNRLPSDLVYNYANTTIGSLAFFLRGADTSQWSDATSSGYFAKPVAGTANVAGGIAKGSTSPSVNLNGSASWATAKLYTAAGAWSLSFWVQTTSTILTSYVFAGGVVNLTNGPASIVQINNGTQIRFEGTNASTDFSTTVPFLSDGRPHHIVISSDGSTVAAWRIYCDGVSQAITTSSVVVNNLIMNQIGLPVGVTVTSSISGFNGLVEDVAVFNKQLSAAEVLGLYQRSFGFLEETSATRVTRILDDVGWPATWRTISTTTDAAVGELVYNANTANSLLQEVQRSEQGRIFAGKTNFVTFLERYYVQEQTAGKTVQQVFSDDGDSAALPYSTFGFQYNDIDVTNDATVTTPITYSSSSDATSKTTYGLQSLKVDTNLSTFDQAQSMAKGLVARGKSATYRLSPIMSYPVKNTTRWPTVLGLELGHRVSFEITPMAVGAQNVQQVSVEGMEWLIEAGLWSFIVTGEPTKDVWFIVDDASSLVGGTRVIGY